MRSIPMVLGLTFAAGVASASTPDRAVAVLRPTQGAAVEGKVVFVKAQAGVKVSVEVKGLTPGRHGFHIHEFGDCSAPDATSAGGHFNPGGHPHAGPLDPARHAGDMGNLEANAEGIARLDYVDAGMAFEGAGSILGRGVVVHASPDDLKTQPTGNAGGRVACGVIGVVKGE